MSIITPSVPFAERWTMNMYLIFTVMGLLIILLFIMLMHMRVVLDRENNKTLKYYHASKRTGGERNRSEIWY